MIISLIHPADKNRGRDHATVRNGKDDCRDREMISVIQRVKTLMSQFIRGGKRGNRLHSEVASIRVA